MELKQKLELRKLLAPELRQSLQILTLPIMDLKELVDQEMLDNPVLEEAPAESLDKMLDALSSAAPDAQNLSPGSPSTEEDNQKREFAQSTMTKKVSLQDTLLKQLGMFADSADDIAIGHEIIGNIDDNGYLRASLEEIASALNISVQKTEKVLKIVQQFEPAGVGARNIPECLLIQLALARETDPELLTIVKYHLEDVATKNYAKIAKALKESVEKVLELVAKISALDPKPGRNFSVDDIQQVIPDIIIEQAEEGELKVTINNESMPRLLISKTYRQMARQKDLDPAAKEFLTNKIKRAYEILRAITKRQSTLRRVVETIVQIQKEAITQDISLLKPLTFREVAGIISMHESTVCRVVMNKYAQTPCGVYALKDFFPSKLPGAKNGNGEAVSSEHVKSLITDYIAAEDKKHPLSDEDIVKLLREKKQLDVARRTVAKYREEMKILSSSYRRTR
ncbi:MAG TPA: RNA polymerase factor sigma-54 [Candidatus Omnitrophota bacterium]|nr:RNA polymerase factor sigma-54 [Candidatus Omnitrophota bacterium]HQJ16244.1 RNA polymerase factor sigma-54 [Candidatus Omnitrophota bacterium]